jgi:prevent-host-death family protein
VGQVPIRELNQDTAGVLARVEAGEVVEVTNRGRPVARIVPVAVDVVADLVAAGIITPAPNPGPIPPPTLAAPTGSDAGALLREMRDDERY